MSLRFGRVGVIALGEPERATTWSGIPAGVMRGLRAAGVEVVGVDADLPGAARLPALAAAAAVRRNRYDAAYAPELAAVRRGVLRARLRRSAPLDLAVQLGSEFELPPGTPVVTLQDMTPRQARRTHPVFRRVSASTLERWDARQGRIYHQARACCTASTWCARSVIEDYGVPEGKVHVVGFGRNHDPPSPAREWNSPRYLFVGREWERKNGPVVVSAFARVRQRHPEARLDVVGGHPAPLRAAGVTGHGFLSMDDARDRDLLARLYARATCFVMPSECEPFGMAYVEAGAAGIPSIATTVGGAVDIVTEETGALVPPGDEEALVAAMLALADPDTARRRGAAAEHRARTFTWEAVGERLLGAAKDGSRA